MQACCTLMEDDVTLPLHPPLTLTCMQVVRGISAAVTSKPYCDRACYIINARVPFRQCNSAAGM